MFHICNRKYMYEFSELTVDQARQVAQDFSYITDPHQYLFGTNGTGKVIKAIRKEQQ